MQTTRRDMLRNTALLGGAALLGTGQNLLAQHQHEHHEHHEHAEPVVCTACPNTIYTNLLGWTIGPQIYSFNRFTFEQGIKNCQKAGARHFEIFLGQKLTDKSEARVDPGMSKEDKKLMRKIMADHGMIPHAVGVCGSGRREFDFAAEMGIPLINSEPDFNELNDVNKLAEEYKITVGLHNHPKDSRYWDYKIVLEQLKDCGSRIGACADNGHWITSGIDPLEALTALKGKIVSFHMKDRNQLGSGHDLPFGTGVSRIADTLKLMAEQHFRGPFSIEYEHEWDNNTPLIAQSIEFFNATAKQIVLG